LTRKPLVPVIFIALCIPAGVTAVHATSRMLQAPSFRHGALSVYDLLKLCVVLSFALFVLLRGPARAPSRDPRAFAACAVAMGALVLIRAPQMGSTTPLLVAGELLTVLAAAWLVAAVLTLGRCFSVLPEARGLVTAGPYSIVRHPVYLGEFGVCAGLVLSAPRVTNFGAAALFAVAQRMRMRMEERALTAEFPQYDDYARTTPRLVPRVKALGRRESPSSTIAVETAT
jgi:protein-S-isoprenylcysteine O-methyltransferase Ste14